MLLERFIFVSSTVFGAVDTDTGTTYMPGTSDCTRVWRHFANPFVILTFAIKACEEDEMDGHGMGLARVQIVSDPNLKDPKLSLHDPDPSDLMGLGSLVFNGSRKSLLTCKIWAFCKSLFFSYFYKWLISICYKYLIII